MKRKEQGLTLIEMLVVLGIIATIAGLLIPATQAVRRYAKNTQQKVQFSNIETALEVWRQDFGDYPASNSEGISGTQPTYCGSQKLAIALMGLDLRGYSPSTPLSDVGITNTTSTGIETWYYNNGNDDPNNRQERYLDIGVARPYLLNQMWNNIPGLNIDGLNYGLAENGFVLTDIFGYKPVSFQRTTTSGDPITETRRAGSPILYFRANQTGNYLFPNNMTSGSIENGPIYQYADNEALVEAKHIAEGKPNLPGRYASIDHPSFYDSIRDPLVPMMGGTISGNGMPHRPDSYILISAGADGIYGTEDDIRNFD